jgi:hypothetical protein
MTSSEAWIWYGHLKQPADTNSTATANREPGWDTGAVVMRPESHNPVLATDNPNNFFARQWGLGRVAILLRDPDPVTGEIYQFPNAPPGPGRDAQWYITRRTGAAQSATSTAPLSLPAGATTNGTNTSSPAVEMGHSRYDLAGTTLDKFRDTLRNTVLPARGAGAQTWYGGDNMTLRFAGYPYPLKPLSSYGVARTAPWLVGGCTNFMVEYAGDYLRQDAAGVITDSYRDDLNGDGQPGTDGLTDFLIDASGARRIRWYGMPRDVGGPTGLPDGTVTAAFDVVPLTAFIPLVPHEHINANINMTTFAVNQDGEYIAAWQPSGTYTDAAGAPVGDPPKPTMVRITMTIDDPDSRLPEGQTYEYVIELP